MSHVESTEQTLGNSDFKLMSTLSSINSHPQTHRDKPLSSAGTAGKSLPRAPRGKKKESVALPCGGNLTRMYFFFFFRKSESTGAWLAAPKPKIFQREEGAIMLLDFQNSKSHCERHGACAPRKHMVIVGISVEIRGPLVLHF